MQSTWKATMGRVIQEKVASAKKPPRPRAARPPVTPTGFISIDKKERDPFATPVWFKFLLGISFVASFAILGLMIWLAVELVPPLVHWLERH